MGELVFWVRNNIRSVEVGQNVHQTASNWCTCVCSVYGHVSATNSPPQSPLPIPVVSDSASIVTLTSQVSDGIKWYLLIFCDEHLQLSHTDTKVRLVKPVWNVPSKRPKLATFLDKCMKETQSKQQLFP